MSHYGYIVVSTMNSLRSQRDWINIFYLNHAYVQNRYVQKPKNAAQASTQHISPSHE